MIKFVLVLSACLLLVEGLPAFPAELAEAARNDNWEKFQTLLGRTSVGPNWPAALAGSVESLKPVDGGQVYGRSYSAYKEWRNENGNISENGKGVEVENINGQVTKRKFNI